MEITNVNVMTSEYGDYALSCQHDGARYHVWLDRKTRTFNRRGVHNFLFKNPLIGCTKEDEFRTRKLRMDSQFGAELIQQMREQADAGNMFDLAEEKVKAEKEAEREKWQATLRLKQIQEAGPELLKELEHALADVESRLYMLPLVERENQRAILVAQAKRYRAAIEKATGGQS